MKEVTLTELRRNIFRLVDEALETGEPIVVSRKGRRLVLQGEALSHAAPETDAEREQRWERFWAEPPPPGWEDIDLSPAALRAARQEYWTWNEEPELDP